MARQTIGATRLAQRTAGAAANANFEELYARTEVAEVAGATAAGTLVVPAGYAITGIYFSGNNENAVTGGIKIGTTVGDDDVVAAQAVGANSIGQVADADILIKLFSKTVDQTLYFTAVTAWNGANVDLIVYMREVW